MTCAEVASEETRKAKDLDAAWAWFREQSSLELCSEGPNEWAVTDAYGEGWFVEPTRDGAVLAAWRAATKQNNENNEKGEK